MLERFINRLFESDSHESLEFRIRFFDFTLREKVPEGRTAATLTSGAPVLVPTLSVGQLTALGISPRRNSWS